MRPPSLARRRDGGGDLAHGVVWDGRPRTWPWKSMAPPASWRSGQVSADVQEIGRPGKNLKTRSLRSRTRFAIVFPTNNPGRQHGAGNHGSGEGAAVC